MKKCLLSLFALVLLLSAGCGEKVNNHVTDYTVDVPDGFEETEMDGVKDCWYAQDGSSINTTVTAKQSGADAAFQLITADLARETLKEMFKTTFDAEPAITDRFFTKDDVCGLPAYQYCYDVELNGTAMTQLMVTVNADKLYAFTYTDMTGDWIDAFQESAKNIQLTIE